MAFPFPFYNFMRIDVYHHFVLDNEQFICLIEKIEKGNHTVMSAITDLQAKFDAAMAKAAKAFDDAASALNLLAQRVADLTAQVAAGQTVDPNELAALETDISAAADSLSAKADAIEGTIGTDTAPPPPSVVPPVPTDPNAPPVAPAPQVKRGSAF